MIMDSTGWRQREACNLSDNDDNNSPEWANVSLWRNFQPSDCISMATVGMSCTLFQKIPFSLFTAANNSTSLPPRFALLSALSRFSSERIFFLLFNCDNSNNFVLWLSINIRRLFWFPLILHKSSSLTILSFSLPEDALRSGNLLI